MALTEITPANFAETVKSDRIVVLDFWADWCVPCQQFAPVFEQVSQEYPDVVFGTVDTMAEQQLARMMGIATIPTVMAFREGIMVFNSPGGLAAADLRQLVEAAEGLDMDEVRRIAMTKAEHLTTVDVEAFAELCADQDVTVVDVRSPQEFASGHIAGAANCDVHDPHFGQFIAELDPHRPYALYCHVGVRSAEAKKQMYAAGIDTVADLEGGLDAWIAAGRQIVQD